MTDTQEDSELMIEVQNLTKYYGAKAAIKDLSFSIPRGEIIGFLGPNGAGKSTTMRIIAGYLSASSGSACIAGFDITKKSEEVRRRIGFMPEDNPLHEDMRVREYLKFRARIKGLTSQKSRNRAEEVIEQFDLFDARNSIIGELSKGFRQRVGLADALIHEPELLVLDEPTIGLDPHQIRTVRQHIKSMGGQHTILMSSHILPEVEVTCSRVLIFHEGNIRANNTPRALENSIGERHKITVELKASLEDLNQTWEEMAEVEYHRVSPAEGDFFRSILTPRDGEDLRPRISALARARGWPLKELTRDRHTLEDIFIHITRSEEEF
tara:strand:- start:1165 stop:2136 length:972 start_codon:yes stop_codon:yes gene_type:complete